MKRLVERVRQPAYTGENRCTPCTVLNLLVAVAVSATLVVVSPGLAVLAFAVSVVVIYLRGYLVPGTPTITARYVPAAVLELFGKEPVALEDDATSAGVSAVASCGAVERRPDGNRRLTPSFRRAWNDRIRTVDATAVGSDDVADLFGVEPEAVTELGEERHLVGDERLVQWLSDPALVADVTAGRELRARCPEWDDRSVEERIETLTTLRLLRHECPACGGSLSRVEETVESCCQPPADVVSVFCEECGAQLAEARTD